jgi:hypothetical protein
LDDADDETKYSKRLLFHNNFFIAMMSEGECSKLQHFLLTLARTKYLSKVQICEAIALSLADAAQWQWTIRF